MKKAILALILIFIFVLIFIPLLYFTIGKTKSPLENLTSKSGLNASGGILGKNYAPAPSDSSDVVDAQKQKEAYAENLNKCFSNMEIQYGGAFLISSDQGVVHNYSNSQAKFLWTTKDSKIEEAKTDSERKNLKNGAYLIISIPNKECPISPTQSITSAFARYNDEGYLLSQIYNSNKNPSQFDYTEKGVSDINSRRYYWYLFEDVSRLESSLDPQSTAVKKYQVTAVTIDNGLVYKFVFSGDSTVFGKARNFVAKTQEFLAGFRFGI